MVSTTTALGLSKRRQAENPFPLAGMKHSIRNPFPLARKTAPAVRNRKMEENWFTTNFKHCVHQQKKAPNKSTKFVVNRKSISTSQNEGFLEKCDFTEPKSCFHLSQYLKKN